MGMGLFSFFHPDCTVGRGIKPQSCIDIISARGLSTTDWEFHPTLKERITVYIIDNKVSSRFFCGMSSRSLTRMSSRAECNGVERSLFHNA